MIRTLDQLKGWMEKKAVEHPELESALRGIWVLALHEVTFDGTSEADASETAIADAECIIENKEHYA